MIGKNFSYFKAGGNGLFHYFVAAPPANIQNRDSVRPVAWTLLWLNLSLVSKNLFCPRSPRFYEK